MIVFSENQCEPKHILKHLRLCDDNFHPPLSSRVVLTEYASKLCSVSERFEAWIGDELVGLVAAYCNDRRKKCHSRVHAAVIER